MTAAATATSVDQRQYERIATALTGRLFVPAEECTLECRIINLSAGGAGVECDEPPPLNAFVVLYVDGFGRFDCVATRYVKGELGLRFVCKEAKRRRLVEDLTSFVQTGITRKTRLRAHRRLPSDTATHFTRANGATAPCQVMDISLQGLSLCTDLQPPIGEIISLGVCHGRVVRHLDSGIAIQFVHTSEGTDHGR
jgi:hypothetical protein